ncbi:hypothetical protein F383_21256 [Gossypium arboreum]|uniref:Uncharacterized protein n=1 Tax=Gossypium arboreum TaxID=29729 RepID=A0A0B0MSL6_GOSAR|nr:hypothetical protein F383_21256 [Gossypium arboreum]
MIIIHSITNLPCNHQIISLKYILVPYRINFIFSIMVAIPNEPLRIIISNTQENLAQEVPHIHYWACSHKLSVET